jgi:DNA invertase Pin-like site-specific DNA recombinase
VQATRGAPDSVTALIYSRVSQLEQADEGVSLPAQVAECRRYVSRLGWIFGDELQDIETGRRDDRPAYQRLLSSVRGLALAGHRPAVVVASLDRLGRNIAERVRAYEELKQLGAPIHTVREGGLVSEFTYNILAAVAQEESRKLGERVRASGKYFQERGWHPVGRVAWGYRWRPATAEERAEGSPTKTMEPHPEEAPFVQEAWRRLAEGESMQSVARWAAQLPSEARGGRNLRFTTVRRLMRAPVYIGRFGEYADDVLSRPAGRWEPLIDAETWQRAQDSLVLAQRMPRQASGEFPLTGLLRCFRCGARMNGRTNPAQPARRRRDPSREYVCTGWAEGAKRAGKKCSTVVVAGAVEDAVLGTVGEMLTAVDRPQVRPAARKAWAERERAARADTTAQRIAVLEQQLQTTRRRISALSVKFLDGELDRTAYDLTRADLQADLDGAENELIQLRTQVKPATLPPLDGLLRGAGGWARAMQTAAPGPVRQALGVLVERVEPVRLGRGAYEARVAWSPIGEMLLGAALAVAPSGNLMSVDQFGHP